MTEITMEIKDWILLGHYLHFYLEGKELQNDIVEVRRFACLLYLFSHLDTGGRSSINCPR
jgi:hypothetical protein